MKFWCFIVGAAPLDPDLEAFWQRLGFLVVQGYGLTETAPIVTLNHPFRTRRGSVGTPIAGMQVRIAADGEILVKGDNVTTGYYGGTAEDDAVFEDGWFHTGDLGALDDAGRLQVHGRKKEMIVTPEGLNVFPEDVERVVDTLPGVDESAVIGLTREGGERVYAVVVPNAPASPGDIARAANRRLADHQKVREVLVWPGDRLPRTEGNPEAQAAGREELGGTGPGAGAGRGIRRGTLRVVDSRAHRRQSGEPEHPPGRARTELARAGRTADDPRGPSWTPRSTSGGWAGPRRSRTSKPSSRRRPARPPRRGRRSPPRAGIRPGRSGASAGPRSRCGSSP